MAVLNAERPENLHEHMVTTKEALPSRSPLENKTQQNLYQCPSSWRAVCFPVESSADVMAAQRSKARQGYQYGCCESRMPTLGSKAETDDNKNCAPFLASEEEKPVIAASPSVAWGWGQCVAHHREQVWLCAPIQKHQWQPVGEEEKTVSPLHGAEWALCAAAPVRGRRWAALPSQTPHRLGRLENAVLISRGRELLSRGHLQPWWQAALLIGGDKLLRAAQLEWAHCWSWELRGDKAAGLPLPSEEQTKRRWSAPEVLARPSSMASSSPSEWVSQLLEQWLSSLYFGEEYYDRPESKIAVIMMVWFGGQNSCF